MKKVSVKFSKSGKWALSLTKQLVFSKGETHPNIPLDVADKMVSNNYGEVVDSVCDKVTETKDLNPPEAPPVASCIALSGLSMEILRSVGDYYEVKDNKKQDLVEKIVKAQVYTQDILDEFDDDDLVETAQVLGHDVDFVEDEGNLTEEEVNKITSLMVKDPDEEE